MTTSESKGQFFYKTNRFESIRVTNRIESFRIANWNALLQRWYCVTGECTFQIQVWISHQPCDIYILCPQLTNDSLPHGVVYIECIIARSLVVFGG